MKNLLKVVINGKNNPTYFINYAQGLTGPPYEFWIDLEVRDTHI